MTKAKRRSHDAVPNAGGTIAALKPNKVPNEIPYLPFGRGILPPGALVQLDAKTARATNARDEGTYKTGTLWVWSRNDKQHYLMQASFWKHYHRVQAVFWHPTIAQCLRNLIAGRGVPELAVYTMLREAGILPLPEWH